MWSNWDPILITNKNGWCKNQDHFQKHTSTLKGFADSQKLHTSFQFASMQGAVWCNVACRRVRPHLYYFSTKYLCLCVWVYAVYFDVIHNLTSLGDLYIRNHPTASEKNIRARFQIRSLESININKNLDRFYGMPIVDFARLEVWHECCVSFVDAEVVYITLTLHDLPQSDIRREYRFRAQLQWELLFLVVSGVATQESVRPGSKGHVTTALSPSRRSGSVEFHRITI